MAVGSVVIAGGKGVRAWPFCGIRQKVTLPILNVPIVARLVNSFRNSGVTQIVVVLGHGADAVKSCLAHIENVRFVEPEICRSPTEAALHGIKHLDTESVVICHGDIVTTESKIKMVCDYASKNPGEYGLLVSGPTKRARECVSVESRLDGTVSALRQADTPFLPLCTGIFIAPSRAFVAHAIDALENIEVLEGEGERSGCELWQVFARLVEGNRHVHGLYSRDFVVDIDMAWQLAEANYFALEEFFSKIEENVIHSGAMTHSSAYVDANAKLYLEDGAELGRRCDVQGNLYIQKGGRLVNGVITRNNALVGKNSLAENYCLISANTVLGADCNLGFNAAFMGCALDGVSIRHEAQVCAILGRKVNVAGGVLTGNLRFDNRNARHEGKYSGWDSGIYGNLMIVGDESQIGSGAVFHPGMRVGYQSCVGPASIIKKDVPERTRTVVSQVLNFRQWNPELYGGNS